MAAAEPLSIRHAVNKLYDLRQGLGPPGARPPGRKDLLLYGKTQKILLKVGANTVNITYQGVFEKFIAKYIKRDLKTMSERTQKAVEPSISKGPCHLCQGARLSPEALSVKVGGYNIAELSAMEVDELVGAIRGLSEPQAKPILKALESGLTHLCDIGLEYLSLNRETDSLSGGLHPSGRARLFACVTSWRALRWLCCG